MSDCRCICHVEHAREMRKQAAELRGRAAELLVTARAEAKALEEQAAGLVDQAEAQERGEPQGGVFLLVQEPAGGHDGHDLVRREYPALDPPASFVDCWTCGVTWEVGR